MVDVRILRALLWSVQKARLVHRLVDAKWLHLFISLHFPSANGQVTRHSQTSLGISVYRTFVASQTDIYK